MKAFSLTLFQDFGLAAPILRALNEEGYSTPTPIQLQAIPELIRGRDVIGIAQTGTGKTAAFALPIIQRLSEAARRPERKACRALVLSPTRELSGQILDSMRAYGRHLKLQATLAIGGVPIGRQIRALANGVDILVATPGRLLDLVNENALRLDKIEIFVLDEADRMLDMGFINDIRKIVSKLPAQRQTLLFSATMPADIADLAARMLKDPATVAVTPVASTAERIAQRVIHLDRGAKPEALAEILRGETVDRALVFTRTKHGADKVARGLTRDGIAADAIHGNKSQNQRERTLAAFRAGRIRTLVATDIAARGIDVDGVSHVVNFDLPNVPESYVHRIGRTARAGAEGVAISLVCADEVAYLRDIQRLIRMEIPATGTAAVAPKGQRSQSGRDQTRQDQARRRPGRNQQRVNGGERGEARAQQAAPNTKNAPKNARKNPRRNGSAQDKAPQGQFGRQRTNAEQPHNNDRARPVASTQPIGGAFSGIAFMQTR